MTTENCFPLANTLTPDETTRVQASPLHERIKAACGNRTYKAVAEATGHHSETVRRYLRGHAPSVEFLEALCVSLALNPAWLLTGSGPMHQKDVRGATLGQANPSDLLAAVAETLEKLIDRVDRIESYVQMLDVRLRHANTIPTINIPQKSPDTPAEESHNDTTDDSTGTNAATIIASALTKRPRADNH